MRNTCPRERLEALRKSGAVKTDLAGGDQMKDDGDGHGIRDVDEDELEFHSAFVQDDDVILEQLAKENNDLCFPQSNTEESKN